MAEASESSLVLVTGAAGYIATHIIQQLQEAGYRVRGTLPSLGDEDKVKLLTELVPEAEHKLELVEADLSKPESWEPAVKDVTYVLHVATPFQDQTPAPKDENEVIQPEVEGVQAVLKACVQAKSVKRVVLTSSCVAVGWGPAVVEADKVFTEEDWTDAEKLDAYGKSKTLAEKAAWDYVKELPDEDKIELVAMNPAYVMGPVINGSPCASMEVVKRLLERSLPFVPKLNFPIVDVRDVATAHIKAMTMDEAAGKRHLCVNNNMWMKEIAVILAKEFKSQGYNVPTKEAGNFLLWVASVFDRSVKTIMPQIGKVYKFDNSRMKDVLGVAPKDAKETLVDMAYSLIDHKIVKKTKKFKGPGGDATETAGEGEPAEGEKKEGEGEEKPTQNGEVKEGEEGEKEKEGEKEPEDKEKKEDEQKEEEEKMEEKEPEDKATEQADVKIEETQAVE